MYIPNNIKRIIGKRDFSIDRMGMSEASVICCEDMVLKVEKSCVESDNENKMMEWLLDKIPVPKIIYLEKVENIFDFLNENNGKWEVKDNTVQFYDATLLTKYNSLVSSVNIIANTLRMGL